MSKVGFSRASKRIVVLALTTATAALMAVGLFSHLTNANDMAHYQTFFDTDVAQAGYGGMRGIGTGTITLSGVSGTIDTALLYWHGPTDSTDPTVNASVTFGGHAVTGTNIGLSSDNFWGFDNSQAYRADVTSFVTGDGSYALANLTKPAADINGASLIVFFDDGNAANNRDVVLFEGNDSNDTNIYDADGWNVTLAGINYTSGTASIDLHVSDGQTWLDDALLLNGSTTLAPAGAVFDGDSVPNGASAGSTGGGLWDIHSYDVTSELTPGQNTLTLTTDVLQDYLSLVVAAANLPAGAAPTLEPTVTPTGRATIRHRTSTPAPEPTDTPAPPTATSQPPAPTLPPPTATPGETAAPQIVAPSTGEGPGDGASPLRGLLTVALAAIALGSGVYLRMVRHRG